MKKVSLLVALALMAPAPSLASASPTTTSTALPPLATLVGSSPDTQIPTASGVARASDGTTYVADRDADRIVFLTPGATSWMPLTNPLGAGSGLDQVSSPSSITVGADGDLYIADSGNNRILRWTPGLVSGTVAAGKPVNTGTLDSLGAPSQVAFDDAGNMYVADTENHRVLRFDTFGEGVTGTLIAGTGSSGSGLDELSYPMGIAVGTGTDPVVYVADSYNNRVVAWNQGDATGTVLATGFVHPKALVRAGTDLYVADFYNYRIAKITAGGTVTTAAGDQTNGWSQSKLRAPTSLSLTSTSPVAFLVAEADRVSHWEAAASLGTVLLGPTADPGFALSSSASAVRVRPDGVYVADGSKVTRFDPLTGAGTVVAGGIVSGSALNQLSGASGLAFDAAGNMYVSESGNHRVTRWAPSATTGTLVAGSGTAGSALSQLATPSGIDVTANGTLYVADRQNNRVVRWDPSATTGTLVAGGLPIGSDLDKFYWVTDVRVDADGNVFVLDFYNHRVTRWAPGASAGVVVAGGNGGGSDATQLFRPIALSLDGAGGVLVASATGRVDHWPLGAAAGQNVVVDALVATPQGIDVDADGRVFIVDAHYRTLLAQKLTAPVSFGAIADRTLDASPFVVSYSAPASSAAVLSSDTPAVCTVSGATVTLVATGVCTLSLNWGSPLWAQSLASRSFNVAPTPVTTTPPPAPTSTVPAACGTAYTATPGNASIVFTPTTSSGRVCQATASYRRGSRPATSVALTGTAPQSVTAKNGSTYTVTVTRSDGAVATSTLTVGAPAAPAAPTVAPGSRRFTATWARPASNGSSVRYYVVSYRKAGTTKWTTKRTSSRKLTVRVASGSYQIRIAAVNARGQSAWSQTVTTTAR